jgi:rhamnosyltransferase
MSEMILKGSKRAPTGGAGLACNTAAILVVYHPRSEPAPVIERLRPQLACLIVVDNSAQGHPALAQWQNTGDVRFIHHGNVGGLAGAYNAALSWLKRERPQVTHVVFLDDDSDPTVLAAFLGDPAVERLLREETTATAAPAYRDRATGVRGAYVQLKRFRFHYVPREQRGLLPVAFVINSMSVWRCAALQRIGPFNEWLGVDHVDTEYCLRARQAGLSLFVDGDHEFAHSIGERRTYRLLGRTLQAGGYGAARRAMIGRSLAWLSRRYAFSEPAFAVLCLLKLAHEALGILMVEEDRRARLFGLLSGAVAGLFAKEGRRPETR